MIEPISTLEFLLRKEIVINDQSAIRFWLIKTIADATGNDREKWNAIQRVLNGDFDHPRKAPVVWHRKAG